MNTVRRFSHFSALCLGLGLALSAAAPNAASAQGLFGALFGSPPPRAPAPIAPSAYADPAREGGLFGLFGGAQPQPQPQRREQARRGGGGNAFCVRTCDGRYFPISRYRNATPVELCNAFCPAAETKVFHGGTIDHAVARDGTRYANMENAFVYRKELVPDCTCNGKDALGLARIDPSADPTLRPGDIVATSEGLVAYNVTRSKRGRRSVENFTPVEHYAGLSHDLREQLSNTQVQPAY